MFQFCYFLGVKVGQLRAFKVLLWIRCDNFILFVNSVIINLMRERKVWTGEEDRVLKLLIEDRGVTKWSQISDIMEMQFSMMGRNGKQCRQRYHNHLDKNISNSQWTIEQENRLFEQQDEVGNKWALIANRLPGRSDNCVKNHFYSKLRKGLRKINKKINKHLKRQYKEIKTAVLYKIIEQLQNRNRGSFEVEEDTLQLCRKVKNRLRQYDNSENEYENINQQMNFIRIIIEDMATFDKDIKKNGKKSNLKSSLKMEDQVSSPKAKSVQISTKSAYDEDQSSYSNSDLFSSSSFDHRSFCSKGSIQSRKFKTQNLMLSRSQSIQSESQKDSDPEQKILYRSANVKSLSKLRKNDEKKTVELQCNSLRLTVPNIYGVPQKVSPPIETKKQESIYSRSNKSSKSNNSAQNQNQIFYTYMMGEQPMQMRLFSPKRLTVQQKIQMDNQHDEMFYGESMEIEGEMLVEKIAGMGINDIPKLGHSNEL